MIVFRPTSIQAPRWSPVGQILGTQAFRHTVNGLRPAPHCSCARVDTFPVGWFNGDCGSLQTVLILRGDHAAAELKIVVGLEEDDLIACFLRPQVGGRIEN